MRILHISRTMGQGGAEKVVCQLCIDNKEAKQFVISCGGLHVKKLEEHGIRNYFMPDLDNKNPFNMLKCFFLILFVVIKEKINIIHSHHRMAAFYARIISMIFPVKCIYTAHNVFNDKRKLTKFALEHTRIVAVGNGVKKNLIDFFGVENKQIDVIYNSVKISKTGLKNYLLEKKKMNGMRLIGCIGRLTEQKGIDIFIRAIGLVVKNYPSVTGVIVGDGELKGELERLKDDLKLSNHILFLGYQDNIIDIIEQFDFVVLPSRWEGFPLTPIETFSQKKTVIATDIPGNNEIVMENNGLLFEKNNFKELSLLIMELLESNTLLTTLEENAFLSYKEKYSYERFIENYKKIYKSMLEKEKI